jgi:hypothetical protein
MIRCPTFAENLILIHAANTAARAASAVTDCILQLARGNMNYHVENFA